MPDARHLAARPHERQPVGFIGGHQARVWERRSAGERCDAVRQQFAHFFGDEALSPTEVVEFNWSAEVWNRGARWPCSDRARSSTSERRSGSRWTGFTGRGRRRPRTGTGTWTALCARAGAPPRRCSQRCRRRLTEPDWGDNPMGGSRSTRDHSMHHEPRHQEPPQPPPRSRGRSAADQWPGHLRAGSAKRPPARLRARRVASLP